MARPAGVYECGGVQRKHRILEHCFDDDNGLCMRPLPSPACAKCVLDACLCASLISSIRMPLAVADRACSHACFLPCFTRFSIIIMRTSEISEDFSGFCARPNRSQLRRVSMVERQQHRSARTRPTGRCVQCTDRTVGARGSCGSGSLRARGSARRRLPGRRRSTRTSEPGTLRE